MSRECLFSDPTGCREFIDPKRSNIEVIWEVNILGWILTLSHTKDSINLWWNTCLFCYHEEFHLFNADIIKPETHEVLHLLNPCLNDVTIVPAEFSTANLFIVLGSGWIIGSLLTVETVTTLNQEPIRTSINDNLHFLELRSCIQPTIVQVVSVIGQCVLVVLPKALLLSSKFLGSLSLALSKLLILVLSDLCLEHFLLVGIIQQQQ